MRRKSHLRLPTPIKDRRTYDIEAILIFMALAVFAAVALGVVILYIRHLP